MFDSGGLAYAPLSEAWSSPLLTSSDWEAPAAQKPHFPLQPIEQKSYPHRADTAPLRTAVRERSIGEEDVKVYISQKYATGGIEGVRSLLPFKAARDLGRPDAWRGRKKTSSFMERFSDDELLLLLLTGIFVFISIVL